MEQTADQPAAQPWHIEVRDLAMAYGDRVVLSGINFTVKRDEIFIIMGGSGSGKSTLLRHMVGLIEPATGEVLYNGVSFTRADPQEREAMLRRFGILYQGGALWSSMTLAENVGLPLAQFTRLRPDEIREVVSLKLAMVGLKGFGDFYPSELSGGMRKRGGLARAIVLDPEVLFFDEPSSGLDPLSARLLDDLILELRASLGATVVVVSHDLASIFAIGDDSLFLDAESGTAIAQGNPKVLLEQCKDPGVHRFLTRGQEAASQARSV